MPTRNAAQTSVTMGRGSANFIFTSSQAIKVTLNTRTQLADLDTGVEAQQQFGHPPGGQSHL